MDEPLVEMVTAKPQPWLNSLVAGYTGYRIEGAPPVCTAAYHRVA
jgi:hypothetical protein